MRATALLPLPIPPVIPTVGRGVEITDAEAVYFA
jgi:hypothetical protein